MRHLENAFKLAFKNFVIVIPLLIATAIPALIMSIGSIGFISNMQQFIDVMTDIIKGNQQVLDYNFFINLYGPTMIISMIVAAVISLILSIFVYPITYGLINKKYETGSASLSDISGCISKYTGRFILYVLLTFAISLVTTIILSVFCFVGALVSATVSVPLGIIIIIISTLLFFAVLIAINTYLSLWFPAICIEDSGVIEGLKNSFKYVSGSFWPILGISILVQLCSSVAGFILSSIIGIIPIMGGLVSPVVGAIAEFILILFYFEVYREKTGRYFIPVTPETVFPKYTVQDTMPEISSEQVNSKEPEDNKDSNEQEKDGEV